MFRRSENNSSSQSKGSILETMSIEVPTSKAKKSKIEVERFEHSHQLKKLDALTNEFFECMECMVRFASSDHLLQHLDTHDHFNPQPSENVDEEYVKCSLCPFSLSGMQDVMSDEDIKDALKRHTIVKHFGANLPASLIQAPEFTKDEEEKPEDDLKVFKCSVCSRSFEQLYQRRVHERYFHSDTALQDFAHLKKMIKCPDCKTLCKDESQFRLHKELYCNIGFDCKQCSERFPRISLFATHMRLKHGALAGGAKSRDIFMPTAIVSEDQEDEEGDVVVPVKKTVCHKCVLCGVVQNSGEALMNHFLSRHKYDVTSIKQVQCDKCSTCASDAKTFVDHYKKHHCN